jgi:hypothetical protein
MSGTRYDFGSSVDPASGETPVAASVGVYIRVQFAVEEPMQMTVELKKIQVA